MARLAKFSDAMSSMDVNCVTDAVAAARRWPMAWRGVRTRLNMAPRAPLSTNGFGHCARHLAPLLLGDELGHLAVDLLEGL